MGKFLAFLSVGSFFATVEEFLTVVELRHDLGSYLFIFTYAAGLLAPQSLRFNVVVGLVVLGYGLLNVFYIRYFLQRYEARIQEV